MTDEQGWPVAALNRIAELDEQLVEADAERTGADEATEVIAAELAEAAAEIERLKNALAHAQRQIDAWERDQREDTMHFALGGR